MKSLGPTSSRPSCLPKPRRQTQHPHRRLLKTHCRQIQRPPQPRYQSLVLRLQFRIGPTPRTCQTMPCWPSKRRLPRWRPSQGHCLQSHRAPPGPQPKAALSPPCDWPPQPKPDLQYLGLAPDTPLYAWDGSWWMNYYDLPFRSPPTCATRIHEDHHAFSIDSCWKRNERQSYRKPAQPWPNAMRLPCTMKAARVGGVAKAWYLDDQSRVCCALPCASSPCPFHSACGRIINDRIPCSRIRTLRTTAAGAMNPCNPMLPCTDALPCAIDRTIQLQQCTLFTFL